MLPRIQDRRLDRVSGRMNLQQHAFLLKFACPKRQQVHTTNVVVDSSEMWQAYFLTKMDPIRLCYLRLRCYEYPGIRHGSDTDFGSERQISILVQLSSHC